MSYTDPLGLEPVGHHYVPRSLWNKEPLPPDTRKVFDRNTTGPIPGGHNYGDGHNRYNEAVKEMYEKWKDKNNIRCETMTPQQAQDFVDKVKKSDDPRIKDFNHRIYNVLSTVLLNACRAEEMSKKYSQDEWTILYNAVSEVCKKFGKEDPYGHGDYWVVDDNWGGASQKIIVATPKFLKKKLVSELSEAIKKTNLLGAEIVIALDMDLPRGKINNMGLIVDSQGVIEQWDIERIREIAGSDFYSE